MAKVFLLTLVGVGSLVALAKPHQPHEISQDSAATMCEAGYYQACLNSSSFLKANR